jgi:hypothetical protein
VCALLPQDDTTVRRTVDALLELVRKEWRPTYLQSNLGTLMPFLLDGVKFDDELTVDAALIYSSLILEGTTLGNVSFRHGTFVNASFARALWTNLAFVECEFSGEVTVDCDATHEAVVFRDCHVEGVRVVDESRDELAREYAPARIALRLDGLGITVEAGGQAVTLEEVAHEEGEVRRLVQRLLRMYRRTTILSDDVLEMRFRGAAKRVRQEVIPLMERHGVVETKVWRGSGHQSAWGLVRSLEETLRADGDPSHPFVRFWADVDKAG